MGVVSKENYASSECVSTRVWNASCMSGNAAWAMQVSNYFCVLREPYTDI